MNLLYVIRNHGEGGPKAELEPVLPGESIVVKPGDGIQCDVPFTEVSSVSRIDEDLQLIVSGSLPITFKHYFSTTSNQNSSIIQFQDQQFQVNELQKMMTIQFSVTDQNNTEHSLFLTPGSSVIVSAGEVFHLNAQDFEVKDLHRHGEDLMIQSHDKDENLIAVLSGFFKATEESSLTPQLKITDLKSDATKDIIVHPHSAIFQWEGEPLPIAVVGSLYGYYFQLKGPDRDNFILTAKTLEGSLPAWLTFSHLAGGSYFLSGTPTSANVGIHEIFIIAHGTQHEIGLHTEQSFELHIRNRDEVSTRSAVDDVAAAEFRKAGEMINADLFAGSILSVEQMSYLTMPEIAVMTALASINTQSMGQQFSSFSTPYELVENKGSIDQLIFNATSKIELEESKTPIETGVENNITNPELNQLFKVEPIILNQETTQETTTTAQTPEGQTANIETTPSTSEFKIMQNDIIAPTNDNTVQHNLLTLNLAPTLPPATFPLFVGVVDLPIYMDGIHGFALSNTGNFNALNATIVPNSDGYDSLLIANDGALSPYSRGFLISGQALFPADVPFTDPSQTMTSFNNNTISSPVSASGSAVHAVSDLNGDSINDFLITSVNGSPTYVVYGDAGGFPTNVSLASLGYGSPNTALKIFGANFVNAAGLGDVNGDHLGDVILSDPNGGLAYVIFSNVVFPNGFANFDINYLNTFPFLKGGFTITGLGAGNDAYQNVTGVNFTGDGVNDIFVGYYDSSTQISSIGVILGSTPSFATTVNVSSSGIVGANGFLITNSAASAGDVLINPTAIGNFIGNGFDDVALSSNNTVYVIFGSSSFLLATSFDVVSLNGSNGFALISPNPSNITSISYVADVNGDGLGDFAFVDSLAYGGQGAVYVIFGSISSFAPTIDYTQLTSSEGFVIQAASGILSTSVVGGGGDLNGDGLGDIVITSGGKEYIVFGSDFFNTITILGTQGNDIITGTTDDIIYGGAGSDNITALNGNNFIDGGLGANTILTGAGNDTIVYRVSDISVDAGTGNDTLWFKNDNTHADLRGTTVFREIDTIDLRPMLTLTGNTVMLDAATILLMTDANSLIVNGDGHDKVTIFAVENWNPTNVILGYTTYTSHTGSVINVENNVEVFIQPRHLSDYIDGVHGFALDSAPINANFLGRGVTIASDINGDGYDDLLVAVQNVHSYMATPVAEAALLLGQTTFPSAHFEITDSGVMGTQFFPITGDGFLGRFVSGVGDFNGDGYHDMLIAPYYNKHAYIVFGDPGGLASSVSLPALGSAGLDIFTSGPSFSTGTAVGDVNGDGLGDVLVANGNTGFGYVVLGSLSPPTSIDVSTLNGTNGFKTMTTGWSGVANQLVFTGVDINGDGYSDIISKTNSSILGKAYVSVILGHATPFTATVDTSTLVPGTGFHIYNSSVSGYNSTGKQMASIGDINGDGYDDLAISGKASFGQATNINNAALYVIFGDPAFSVSGNLDVTSLNGGNGFGLIAPTQNFAYISSISFAGDVNGDGIADFAFIDSQAFGTGAVFVIFGTQDPFTQVVDYLHLTPSEGFALQFGNGIGGNFLGDGGDLNGDGLSDIVLGNPGNSIGGQSQAGSAYVVFGDNSFTNSISIFGTQGDDTLIANTNNEVIYGGAGNDTITTFGGTNFISGGAGADIINGGTGNDRIVYDSHDLSVNGGTGTDTLWLRDDSTLADLRGTTIFTGIDAIDLRPLRSLTGNEAELDPSTVNTMSDANSLIVSGGAHDSLILHNDGADIWSAGPVVLISGNLYTTYTSALTSSVVYGENTLHQVSIV
ncbi:MAG: FG-GAP-like repeat-containing protein [Gammaproteobacteria bacterium]|nr:FG-GAP-like repeat-containing protein [Gammaproteobacteria bacterium]